MKYKNKSKKKVSKYKSNISIYRHFCQKKKKRKGFHYLKIIPEERQKVEGCTKKKTKKIEASQQTLFPAVRPSVV